MEPRTKPAARAPRCEGQETDRDVGDSIEALYEQYLDTVFCYVLQRVPDRSEAEDVTAETFAAAMQAFPRFRGECSALTWLLGIARQKIAESSRRTKSRQLREVPEVELSDQQRETLELLLDVDPRQLPEDQALQKEAEGVMRELLARLPEQQREALLLQAEYDLPVHEIARVLGRTRTATYSLLQRGRAAIFQHGQRYFKE